MLASVAMLREWQGAAASFSFMRERDWQAALFELLIVAVGVLLGIEASNCNQAREAHRRTAQVITVLRQDLDDGIAVKEGQR